MPPARVPALSPDTPGAQVLCASSQHASARAPTVGLGQLENWPNQLLDWWQTNARLGLPWKTSDPRLRPYYTLVSELMLQQTQAGRVITRFPEFVRTFPNLCALASASREQVLARWSGLGYYRRAGYLHDAARQLWHMHQQGQAFPRDPCQLKQLPGVAQSTANAIAAQAFNLPCAILDANARRVLRRLSQIHKEPELWQLAQRLTPANRAGDYCQAIMDFGAAVCTKNPACSNCFATSYCLAYNQGQTSLASPRPARQTMRMVMLLIKNGDALLLGPRQGGIWPGLYNPPGGASLRQALVASGLLPNQLCYQRRIRMKWLLTHRRLQIHALMCTLRCPLPAPPVQAEGFRWIERKHFAELPLASATQKLLKWACD